VKWSIGPVFAAAVTGAVLSCIDSSTVEAFGSAPAAQECPPPDVALSYGREANLEVALPPQTCVDPGEAGILGVWVTFDRRALASNSQRLTLSEFQRLQAAKHCDPRMWCTLRMVMMHLAIEVKAHYRAVIEWRSIGPGPGSLQGNDIVEMRCSFGSAIRAQCTGAVNYG
jgi:hypothetical protein